MKNNYLFCAIFISLLSSNGFSQLMKGHEIDKNRCVTFTVTAPDAKEVKLINLSDEQAMGAKEYSLVKGEKGLWTVTTNPCRPGFHYYELSIDGFHCADPSSQLYFGWGRWSSGLEVPDDTLNFYLPQNVPHGDIRYHGYQSKTTNAFRKCLVYTPPGYDENISMRYPVLYLQHGAGESELGWSMQGKVNFILDNLIAAGKAKPMLIVMDNGYAASPGVENPQRPGRDENLFAKLVVDELIPMIDSQFRTQPNRENRAIAGLSMGAGQALQIGLDKPDLFASVGAFSGGVWRQFDLNTSFSGVFKEAAKFNETFRVFWIGCGKLDNGFESLSKFHEALLQQGIRHVWYEGPGSHEWQVWRRHIHEFAPLLFQ
jgi:enterochelin esterase-like enzyme